VTPEPLLAVRDLTIQYAAGAAAPVLDHVSFDVSAGETVGLLGVSGSGKSTLLLALVGLLPPAARVTGSVRWKGEELIGAPEGRMRALRGAAIASIFQDPAAALNPVLRAGTQVAEVLRAHRRTSREAVPGAVDKALRAAGLGDPQAIARAYPHELSGGQRQRVAIAQALAAAPEMLLADEPTSALDSVAEADLLALLRVLTTVQGLALLLVSHNVWTLRRIATRVVVLGDGRVVEQGPVAQVLDQPQAGHTRTLVQAAGLARRPAAAAAPGLHTPALLEGRRVTKDYGTRGGPWGGRGHIHALEAADLRVRAGERVAVVGPSGSGKSTLARCLAGLEAPTSGEVLFDGTAVDRLQEHARRPFRRGVQMVFQEAATSLNPRWDAGRSVAEPLLLLDLAPADDVEHRVGSHLTEVGLPRDVMKRRPHELSGGQRQRVALARALAVGPRALVLDEATTGLDGPIQAQILDLVRDLQERSGLACIFVSHDLRLVAALADRVVVMSEGRIVERGAVEEILGAPSHETTRALVRAAFGSPS